MHRIAEPQQAIQHDAVLRDRYDIHLCKHTGALICELEWPSQCEHCLEKWRREAQNGAVDVEVDAVGCAQNDICRVLVKGMTCGSDGLPAFLHPHIQLKILMIALLCASLDIVLTGADSGGTQQSLSKHKHRQIRSCRTDGASLAGAR